MILVIFGSNLIESAGENLDETKRICEAIFYREDVPPKPRTDAYRQRLEIWIHAKKTEEGGEEHIMRTRNEVIQHARALQYMTEAIITREEPISEQLILDTHRILCHDVNHPKFNTPWRSYTGIYRKKVRKPTIYYRGSDHEEARLFRISGPWSRRCLNRRITVASWDTTPEWAVAQISVPKKKEVTWNSTFLTNTRTSGRSLSNGSTAKASTTQPAGYSFVRQESDWSLLRLWSFVQR